MNNLMWKRQQNFVHRWCKLINVCDLVKKQKIIQIVLCDVLCHAENREPRSGLGEARGSNLGPGFPGVGQGLSGPSAAGGASCAGLLRGGPRCKSTGRKIPRRIFFFVNFIFFNSRILLFPIKKKNKTRRTPLHKNQKIPRVFSGGRRWRPGKKGLPSSPPSPPPSLILFGKVDT